MSAWTGLGRYRVPPNEIHMLRAHVGGALAEACPEEEGGSRGKHGFPRGREPKASDLPTATRS